MMAQQRRSHSRASTHMNEQQLANGLGWFSIGLGVAELLAPRQMAHMIGVQDREKTRTVLRSYGLREIAHGVGILSRPRPTGWVWSRVAGDMLDLAALTSALTSRGSNRTRVAMATTAVLGVTALDLLCGQQMTTNGTTAANGHRVQVKRSVIINRSPEEAYQFWHDFQNLPTFIEHLESVRVMDTQRSHWTAKTPTGHTIEWDAEIVDDRPNERIAWRSVSGSDIDNAGTVTFERAPGGRGTRVELQMEYAPPGGAVGATVARLLGKDPVNRLGQSLRAFKQVMETGEVAKSDASIHWGMHPAQPSNEMSGVKQSVQI